jgi:predicted GIY-YIG superfamily endonuclease
MSFVYLLVSTGGNTYVGATVDLNRRLRQHNKEIKGGATATGIRVAKGETWTRAAHVSGFPDWQATLQFEWRWKQLSRKLNIKLNPLKRRMIALKELLGLERPTSKAKAYTEWTEPRVVHCETEESKEYYDILFNDNGINDNEINDNEINDTI